MAREQAKGSESGAVQPGAGDGAAPRGKGRRTRRASVALVVDEGLDELRDRVKHRKAELSALLAVFACADTKQRLVEAAAGACETMERITSELEDALSEYGQ